MDPSPIASANLVSLCRSTKIVVKAESASDLMEMERKAIGLHLPCYLVVDAGRTQVNNQFICTSLFQLDIIFLPALML